MQEIYLDNSATTKPLDEVIEAMMEYYRDKYGNPSSLHRKGMEAEKAIKYARKEIAKFLKVYDEEIIFTSGGTEGNNLAILGAVSRNKRKGNHVITSTVEHPSVLNAFKKLENDGLDVTYLGVNKEGKVNMEELEKALREDTILVSIMAVNNEVGTVQPISKISKLIKEKNNHCIFHVDGVQAFGKIPCSPREQGIDLFTMSSHKIHGPKGVGVIYIKKGVLLDPIILGGGQEIGIRSGTENVPGIVGMGKAVEKLRHNLDEKIGYLYHLRKMTKDKILESISDVEVNGPTEDEGLAPHILSISFKNIRGEVLLHSLEQEGIYISTGSACSSHKKGQSHVLKNMGIAKGLLEGTIRISLSIYNTPAEIETFVTILKEHVVRLRKIIGRGR